MDKMLELAEQHILESTARLRHIDEMMAQARTVPAKAATAAQLQARLAQIEEERNRLAKELEDLQRQPRPDGSDLAKRGEGLKGLLAAVGLQLEQVLGAVLLHDK